MSVQNHRRVKDSSHDFGPSLHDFIASIQHRSREELLNIIADLYVQNVEKARELRRWLPHDSPAAARLARSLADSAAMQDIESLLDECDKVSPPLLSLHKGQDAKYAESKYDSSPEEETGEEGKEEKEDTEDEEWKRRMGRHGIPHRRAPSIVVEPDEEDGDEGSDEVFVLKIEEDSDPSEEEEADVPAVIDKKVTDLFLAPSFANHRRFNTESELVKRRSKRIIEMYTKPAKSVPAFGATEEEEDEEDEDLEISDDEDLQTDMEGKCFECGAFYSVITMRPQDAYDGVGMVCTGCGRDGSQLPEEPIFYRCTECESVDLCVQCYCAT